MDKHSGRPIKATTTLVEVSVGVNVNSGPHGAVMLVASLSTGEYPQYYYWPLSVHRTLSEGQLRDLGSALVRLVTDCLYTRVQVSDELFKAL
jgi:hypothetical protein